jgi:DNA polymerase I-like protein with 3'-5' exonuclease and polymerase domains
MNKSAHVNWADFIADTFFEPRYWCGKEFVNGPDCWVYPSPDTDHLFPIKCKNNPVNWTTRFFRAQLKKMIKDDLSDKSLDMRPYKIISPKTKEEVSECLKTLVDSELLAVDIETDGFHFIRNRIGTLQLSNDGEIAYFLDWKLVDRRLLNKVLKSAKQSVLANGKFDTRFLYQNGISKDWKFTDDITLLSHAMHSDRPKGLKPAAIFWCGKFTGYDLELDEIKKRLHVENYLQIPFAELEKYSALDAIVTWRVFKALIKRVRYIDKKFPNEKNKEWTIEKWYKEVMIPNVQMIIDVEFEGVYFDNEQFNKSEKVIRNKIAELKAELAKLWNVQPEFPFESTKELGDLFQRMGWPKIAESKAGGYKTSDEVLTEYEARGMPGIKTLKDLRSYSIGLNTFINGWKEHLIDHGDGTYRIHPNCNCFGTKSYRHSMSDPNFQQLPSGAVMASSIKKLFTVPNNDIENWLLVEADFSSLQMRLAMQDEGLSPNGVDQVSYDLYGPTGNQDAHSTTGFNVFFQPLNQQIIEIEDENGKIIKFLPEQKIKVKRRGLVDENEELTIKGEQFLETDEFVGYV